MVLLAKFPGGKSTLGEYFYRTALHIACPSTLYDPEVGPVMEQFIYCRDSHTPPFAGAYGDQPAWWLDASKIIQRELSAEYGTK